MARQRMVKPEFFDSESLGVCSALARLLFIGLWVFSDDQGNQRAQFSRLQSRVFPYDRMDADEFKGLLCELEAVGCIKTYEVDGNRYINIPNFKVYQTIKKPSKTNNPPPPDEVSHARCTQNIVNWPSSGELVGNQWATSSPERKKERRKGSLTTSFPKEGEPTGAAAADAAPSGPPKCLGCGHTFAVGDRRDGKWSCPECGREYEDVIL